MVEKKIKKKLTLTISNKKTFSTPSYAPSSNKKSVVIEKKISRKISSLNSKIKAI